MFGKRYTVTVTHEMSERLEKESKRLLLDSVPETIRMILSDYLSRTKTPSQ